MSKINFKNFNNLGNEIFVYKNFISKEECEKIVLYIKSLNDFEWEFREDHFINVFQITKSSHQILEPIRNRIKEILPNDLIYGPSAFFSKMLKGYDWPVHSDVHDYEHIEKKHSSYIEGDPYTEQELSIYGTVLYFNNFEGGELYYPNQNIIYKPKAGDLVIHGSHDECAHGVKPVKSEVRYSYSNSIRKIVKVPIN